MHRVRGGLKQWSGGGLLRNAFANTFADWAGAMEPRVEVRAVLHGFKARKRAGFDHASASVFGALPVIVLVMGPGDLFLFRAILRIQNPLVDLALVAVDVWSILWLYGIYVTMQERPHAIEGDGVRVHKGILKSAMIPLSAIRGTRCLAAGSFTRADLRGGMRLTVPGAPCVRLDLWERVAVKRAWGKDSKAQTVFVSASDAEGFVRELSAPGDA